MNALLISCLVLISICIFLVWRNDSLDTQLGVAESQNAILIKNEKDKNELIEKQTKDKREHFEQLEAARNEIKTLRSDLADSNVRLSIKAHCPKPRETNSGSSSGKETRETDSKVGQIDSAELTQESENNYVELREGILITEAWIDHAHKALLNCYKKPVTD